MSQQSAATSSTPQVNQALINVGKLWWFATDKAEADRMKADLLAKGVIDVQLGEPNDRGLIDLIFSLDRDRAVEILGFPVADEEWLEAE